MRRYRLILLSGLLLAMPLGAADTDELARQLQVLDARLAKVESALLQNQQLLGLLNEVETLKAEVAKLRGQAEVQVHQLDTLGKRQNDLYVDLDQRLADLTKTVTTPAPAAVAAPKAAPEASANAPGAAPAAAVAPSPQLDPLVESRTYEAALNHFREANYAGAIAGFKGFLKAYPESALAPNAQYWVGYSYYALKDYKSSLAHQQKLLAAYPTSAKVPDALLNIATNQIGLGNIDAARKTLEELVAKHPGTNAATLAAKRLAALK